MGYKRVQKRYGILDQDIAVYDMCSLGGACICIGEAYADRSILIRVSDAKIVKEYVYGSFKDKDEDREFIKNNIILKQDESNGTLKGLIDTPDIFTKSLPIYTIDKKQVVLDYCEEYNSKYNTLTHCGEVMNSNIHFKTRKEAYQRLLSETRFRFKSFGFIYISSRVWFDIKTACNTFFNYVSARTVGRFKTRVRQNGRLE